MKRTPLDKANILGNLAAAKTLSQFESEHCTE